MDQPYDPHAFEPGWKEQVGPYLKLARNLGIIVLLFLILGYFVERDREKHYPRKELSRFEQRYFEPVVAKNYKRYSLPKSRGRHVLLLVPARWNGGKTEVYHDHTALPREIQAQSFAEADTIFYVRDGEKVVEQKYEIKGQAKRVKVRQATVEMLGFDRSGKCLGFYFLSAGSPSSALVFSKQGETPEITSGFSFPPVRWIADLPER
ncbi:MAG: hypothetical protein KF760_29240 [Candidatus Eremiobacteraeota bacterium]|nr:hypothetical protein [Candidatus Eremiobacteraeota bacterium]MCW5865941.1 hypothetical protein [Candidatus Eremiobacteraeota bacterium]